jgi:hypothetical protein
MRLSTRTLRLGALALVSAPMLAAQAQSPTAKIVRAANGFLATLESAQKQRVLFAFDDDKQRVRWSNLPNRMVQRAGLSMGELTPAQRAAAMTMLASALSPRGFEKVQQIVEGDEVLKKNENNNPMFGKDLFFVSILGAPSETAPWMLQFGGHHLALNITIVGAHGVLTPSLTAAQPALYTENGRTVRPLGAESDKAFALLSSLDSAQRAKAILNYRVADLVLGPGQDGKTIQPEGLRATAMNAKQRAMLLDLIAEWSGIVHESAAAARMAEIRAGLDDTWFAWSGSTTHAEGHAGTAYYRIQGPALVIEYAPQPLGGDPTNHIHTIYRDPTNDYGRKLTLK